RFRLVLHLLQDLLGSGLFQFRQNIGGLVRRHLLDNIGGLLRLERLEDACLHLGIDFRERFGRDFFVDRLEDRLVGLRTQLFDDIGKVGRVDVFELRVRDIQTQAALRIGLDDVAEFPADRIRRDRALESPDPNTREHALEETAKNGTYPDIHFQHPQDLVVIFAALFEGDVVDPHDLAPIDVDNLLIEQVAADAQHVLVVVVGSELFIGQPDAVERDCGDLIVTDGEPGAARSYKVAIHAESVGYRQNGSIAYASDPPAFEVVNRQSH